MKMGCSLHGKSVDQEADYSFGNPFLPDPFDKWFSNHPVIIG